MATNTRGILHFNLSTASFFSGIGMAYAVERKQYWHLPTQATNSIKINTISQIILQK